MGRKFRSPDSAALIIALAIVTPIALESRDQTAPQSRPSARATFAQPRTPWGDPDLQGIVWNFATMVPFERPAQFSGKEALTDDEAKAFQDRTTQSRATSNQTAGPDWWDPGNLAMLSRRTSLVVDPPNGRLPAQTEEAQKRAAGRGRGRGGVTDNPEELGLNVRCILWGSAGPPMVPAVYNNNIEFIQTPKYIVIVNEKIHDARIVPMDGRPHGTLRQLVGDSRGRWEGNTLVVDTINFTAQSAFRGSTENLHLVERFTRLDDKTLDYRFTVDDPHTWTQPWTAEFPMTRDAGLMYEYACHEGNYLSMVGILSVARGEEKKSQR